MGINTGLPHDNCAPDSIYYERVWDCYFDEMQDMVYIYIAKMNIRRCNSQGQPLTHAHGSAFAHVYANDDKTKHMHWADLAKAVHKECDSIELNISI